MLVTDAHAVARFAQRAFGKTILSAQRISPHVAQHGHTAAEQFIQETFETATFVANRYQACWLALGFGSGDPCKRVWLKTQLFQNFAPRGVVRVPPILLDD